MMTFRNQLRVPYHQPTTRYDTRHATLTTLHWSLLNDFLFQTNRCDDRVACDVSEFIEYSMSKAVSQIASSERFHRSRSLHARFLTDRKLDMRQVPFVNVFPPNHLLGTRRPFL